MSCGGDSTIAYLRSFYEAKGYVNYRSRTIRFLSTTQPAANTDLYSSYIANNWLGYATELESLGNSVLVTGAVDPREEPYPSRLRPLDDYSVLNKVKDVLINSISFFAFDTTVSGSVNQNATANTAITNSATSLLSKYSFAGVYTAVLPSWNPNFFRPNVKINGVNILDFSLTALGTNNNQGDLSMGATLPYEIEPNYYFGDGIQDIRINAAAAQLVVSGVDTYAKRYPVMCEINLTHG
jgi:hypothetical protein